MASTRASHRESNDADSNHDDRSPYPQPTRWPAVFRFVGCAGCSTGCWWVCVRIYRNLAAPAQPSHRSERDPPGIKVGLARKRWDNGWTPFDDNITAYLSSPQRYLIVSHGSSIAPGKKITISTDSIKAAELFIRTWEPKSPGIMESHV